MIGIGQQIKRKLELGDELLVFGLVVRANAQNGVALSQECLVVIAQAASLGGAAWSVVFGVEVQDQLFAFEVA